MPVKEGQLIRDHTGNVLNSVLLVLLLTLASAFGGCASGRLLPEFQRSRACCLRGLRQCPERIRKH